MRLLLSLLIGLVFGVSVHGAAGSQEPPPYSLVSSNGTLTFITNTVDHILDLTAVVPASTNTGNWMAVGTNSATLNGTGGTAKSPYMRSDTNYVSVEITTNSPAANVLAFGADPSGSSDSAAAITATANSLTSGGVVLIPTGTYKISSTVSITNNGIRIEGAGFNRTTLKLANGVNSYLLTNSWGVGNTMSNLAFVNLTFDGNTANNPGAFQVVRLRNVQDVRFENCVGMNGTGFMINVGNCTRVTFQGIRVFSPKDGIHINGPASYVNVNDIKGITSDDLVAFCAIDWPGYDDDIGPIHDCTVDGLMQMGGLSFGRILGGTNANCVTNITFANVSGTCTNQGWLVSGGYGLKFLNVAMSGTGTSQSVPVWNLSTNNGAIIIDTLHVTGNDNHIITLAGTNKEIVMNNIWVNNPGSNHTATVYIAPTGNLTNLVLNNWTQIGGEEGIFFDDGAAPCNVSIGNSYLSGMTYGIKAAASVNASINGMIADNIADAIFRPEGSLSTYTSRVEVANITYGASVNASVHQGTTNNMYSVNSLSPNFLVNAALLTPQKGDEVYNSNVLMTEGQGRLVRNYANTGWINLESPGNTLTGINGTFYVTKNVNLGGNVPDSRAELFVDGSSGGDGAQWWGVFSNPTLNTNTTSSAGAYYGKLTVSSNQVTGFGLRVDDAGGTSNLTNNQGVAIAALSYGQNNIGLHVGGVEAVAGNWGIYNEALGSNYFKGATLLSSNLDLPALGNLGLVAQVFSGTNTALIGNATAHTLLASNLTSGTLVGIGTAGLLQNATFANWTNAANIFTAGTTKFLREDGTMQTVASGTTNLMTSTISCASATLSPTFAVSGLSTTAASCRRLTMRCTLTNSVTTVSAVAGTLIDGDTMVWELIQDGTGSRTITGWDTSYAFGTDITGITLSTAINTRDFVTWVYNSTATKWYCVGFVRGY